MKHYLVFLSLALVFVARVPAFAGEGHKRYDAPVGDVIPSCMAFMDGKKEGEYCAEAVLEFLSDTGRWIVYPEPTDYWEYPNGERVEIMCAAVIIMQHFGDNWLTVGEALALEYDATCKPIPA